MILLTTTVNLLGVKIISTVNNIGVIAELIGAVGLIIILAVNIQHSPSVLFETDGTGAGHDWGYAGALLLGAIMPLYVMYGFDSAGSLAEETDDPRRTAPKAIWRALLTAGVLGFLLIGFGTMAVDQPATAGGLTSITKDVLGDSWGNLWLADVALAIFVCCLAIQAMSIRILFAMARDNNLPFARGLASVSAKRRVPVAPALTSGIIALIILAFNIQNPSAFTIIISMGIILMYLAYLGVTIPLLKQRFAGWPGQPPGRQGGAVQARRLGRSRSTSSASSMARRWSSTSSGRASRSTSTTPTSGARSTATIVLLGFGLIYYYAVQRHKGGVLEEHRAEAAAGD